MVFVGFVVLFCKPKALGLNNMKLVIMIFKTCIVSEQDLSVLKSELLRDNETDFRAKLHELQYSFSFDHIKSLKVNWVIQITV